MDAARVIASLLLLPCLPACSGRVATASGEELRIDSPAFQHYAERVFRRQNQVGQRLMERQEDATALDAAWVRRLAIAEDRLWSACRLLNEMAITGHGGEAMDLLRQHEAALSVSACDAARMDAERLLRSLPGRDHRTVDP